MTGNSQRAFELDFLRGFAIFMMVLMHFAWDVKYEFGVDTFGFLEAGWFWTFIHPLFLVIFVGVSGICCTFSHNNLTRGIRLAIVAVAMTLVTYIATVYIGINCLIIFNVIALLALGMLIYVLISYIEQKTEAKPETVNAIMLCLGCFVAAIGSQLDFMDYDTNCRIFLPVGFSIRHLPQQADYLPIFPWIGIFLIGCVAGRVCYRTRESLFHNRSGMAKRIMQPFEFIGRHSLIIYLAHQPIIYGILWVIFQLSGDMK